MIEKVGDKATNVIQKLSYLAIKFMTPQRYEHTVSCVNFGLRLAKRHNANSEKVQIACWAHDLFRDFNAKILLRIALSYGININDYELAKPFLLHGKVSAEYIRRRFGIEDEKLLLAIAYHTSGHKCFDITGKILFLADSLEEGRNYENVEKLRQLALQDIEEALLQVLQNKICYAIKRGYILLPDTIETWNELVKKEKLGCFEPDMLQNDKRGEAR